KVEEVSASPPIALQAMPVQFSARLSSATATGTYRWDFGDGATASGATPSHIYSATAVYTVNLSVETSAGTITGQTLLTIKSMTGRWSCFLCSTPIVNFYNLVQTGNTISGTYNNPAVGFVPVTGSVRTTAPYVTFGYPCSVLQEDGTRFDCSASFSGNPAPH